MFKLTSARIEYWTLLLINGNSIRNLSARSSSVFAKISLFFLLSVNRKIRLTIAAMHFDRHCFYSIETKLTLVSMLLVNFNGSIFIMNL